MEMRARLVFLFRALKVDTVLVYDPSALYERNPGSLRHRPRCRVGCGMSGSHWDYPEHFLAGLKPHAPRERYYFARGPQLVNRVVDISAFMDQKVFANLANVTQGPAGNTGAKLRQCLADNGSACRFSAMTMTRRIVNIRRHFALGRDRSSGQAHGLEYAEYFHYIGPDESDVDEYVRRNAVSL